MKRLALIAVLVCAGCVASTTAAVREPAFEIERSTVVNGIPKAAVVKLPADFNSLSESKRCAAIKSAWNEAYQPDPSFRIAIHSGDKMIGYYSPREGVRWTSAGLDVK